MCIFLILIVINFMNIWNAVLNRDGSLSFGSFSSSFVGVFYVSSPSIYKNHLATNSLNPSSFISCYAALHLLYDHLEWSFMNLWDGPRMTISSSMLTVIGVSPPFTDESKSWYSFLVVNKCNSCSLFTWTLMLVSIHALICAGTFAPSNISFIF